MLKIIPVMRRSLPAAVAVIMWATAGFAQEPASRAEEQARQQEEKAKTLKPYQGRLFEERVLAIENSGGFATPRGFLVAFGDIKSGSGIALGPAYGRTFNNGTVVIAKAEYSFKHYKVAQVEYRSPPLSRNRLFFDARVRIQDAPGGPVYALGIDSPETRADYDETKSEVGGNVAFRPVRLLRFGGGAAFERFRTGPADTNNPSVETLFPTLPGLATDPEYLHTRGSAGIDSRDGDRYSRRGSLLRATFHDYREQSNLPLTFQRLDGAAEQFVPILRGNFVLYAGLHASTTYTDGDDTVPFFLMPSLGGRELRGYDTFRFRDRHSIIFTGEYRWYAQEYLDGAFFYDAGKVTPTRGELDFDGLKHDYGVGVRLHGPQRTLLRVEIAHGGEGYRFIFSFNATGG